uniref:TATA-box binding protein associated factor 4b n=1 Tax=Sus scrofa TaxID=9823 RepID=A0A8D1VP79_PIG
MPAGLTEPTGAAPPASVGASGTVTMAPAAALPVRVESTPVALGAVTKAPVSVCVESTASQPLRSPIGTLVTKVAPVSALPKLSSGPRLPAPQIVAVKAPNTTTIQLPANLQLPPGTVLIKSNSGQLMLVSPQQAVTRTEATGNITSRPAVPMNTQTVKICTMPNSSSQLIKKVAVAPVKQLAQVGTTVVTTVPKPSPVQSAAVPTTVTPVKPLNTVTTLKPSSLGASSAPSNEPDLKAENSAAAQANLSPTMLENVKKCKNFLAMLIKLACSGSQSPEMGQNVKKLVEQLLDAKIEAEEFTRQLYVELKSSPQPHLVPFLKKSVIALRQLLPNSQSFIQQCVQQTSSEVVIATCTTTVTPSPVVTTAVSSIQPEKSIVGSEAATPGTVSVQTLNPLAGPGAAKTGVVTLHSVGPAAVPGGTTAGTVVLQTPKPLVTSLQNTVTTVSLQPEKPVVSGAAVGAAVTLALPSVTFGETSAAALCLPSVKPVVTSAGTTSDKPVIGAPVQIKLAQPGPILAQPAGIPQAVKVKQLVVQQPSGGLAKQVTTLSHSSALTIQKSGQKTVTVSTAIPASQFPQASILKQITLPGNKILSLQSPIQKNKIKENGTTSFRDEDDINDVTSMAGVNLSEENACILAANSELVGTLVQSCKDEPFLFIGALQKRILDIGKKHDITEFNSDAVNLISHATQERLRGLLEKLTTIAQHRMTTYKSRSNKEDPEQLRLKQKAKELQQLELAQIQHRDANLTALAAIGPRKKRPLESGSGSEVLKYCCYFIFYIERTSLKEAKNANHLLCLAHYYCQMLIKTLLSGFFFFFFGLFVFLGLNSRHMEVPRLGV